MKGLYRLIVFFVVVVLFALNVYQCQRYNELSPDSTTPADTLIYFDTIPYFLPVPKDSLVIKYITVMLPVPPDTTQDSLIMPPSQDSATVQIPITQKHYETTDYRAYVSGYRPSLDSIFVTRRTEQVVIRQQPKKWNIGVQAGYGLSLQQQPTFTPFIGIGITYNLFSF